MVIVNCRQVSSKKLILLRSQLILVFEWVAELAIVHVMILLYWNYHRNYNSLQISKQLIYHQEVTTASFKYDYSKPSWRAWHHQLRFWIPLIKKHSIMAKKSSNCDKVAILKLIHSCLCWMKKENLWTAYCLEWKLSPLVCKCMDLTSFSP